MPADLGLYDYDNYDDSSDDDEDDDAAPRWPWVVGVAAIVAAIALVVSVSLLFARTDTNKLANPGTSTPVHAADAGRNHHHQATAPTATTATAPPPPPTATETQTVTVTPPPPPPPPPAAGDGHRAAAGLNAGDRSPASATTATTPAGPRQVTYSVTGTKAPGDIISVTYVDASGRSPYAAQRLHPVVDDGHTDLAIRRRLGPGVQPVPGQQAQLLDHHQRRDGAVVEQHRLTADELLMVSRYSAYRRGSDTIPPDVIDRILLGRVRRDLAGAVGRERGRCRRAGRSGPGLSQGVQQYRTARLGAVRRHHRFRADHRRGHPGAVAGTPDGHRPSRRSIRSPAPAGSPGEQAATPRAGGRARFATQRAQAGGTAGEWSGEAVDRVWLRGTVVLTATMGAALIAVAAATYSMAVGHDGPSWVGYGLAGVITAAMPAAEWLYIRQLRRSGCRQLVDTHPRAAVFRMLWRTCAPTRLPRMCWCTADPRRHGRKMSTAVDFSAARRSS